MPVRVFVDSNSQYYVICLMLPFSLGPLVPAFQSCDDKVGVRNVCRSFAPSAAASSGSAYGTWREKHAQIPRTRRLYASYASHYDYLLLDHRLSPASGLCRPRPKRSSVEWAKARAARFGPNVNIPSPRQKSKQIRKVVSKTGPISTLERDADYTWLPLLRRARPSSELSPSELPTSEESTGLFRLVKML